MTIKKVKDNLNKEKRREAFNKIRSKGKYSDPQKGNKSWQKELQDFFSVNDTEEYDENNYESEDESEL